ncbi:MAG TPA: lipoate--protein ligase [Bacteroidales bacterium]|nr:lipoate--protein ligase [Bacteroidales bacterium]
MRCIVDHTTDPYLNLAVEEYLLTTQQEPVFRLWRNIPSIIVGRNQNTLSEINLHYVKDHNIPVVRRLSGGGAVFHDLGNINYTFTDRYVPGMDTGSTFARFTRPILEVLNTLGVKAELEGRNDLVTDGRKFSGNAIARYKDRILMHGTLLFSASMEDLSRALQVKDREETRGVRSRPRSVCNLSEFLPPEITALHFMELLKEHVTGSMAGKPSDRPLQPEEYKVIEALCETGYSTFSWNYGSRHKWEFLRKKRFPGGNVEVCFNAPHGTIESIKIYGDYFFFSPTEEIEKALQGCPRTREGIATCLQPFVWDDYFRNIPPEGLYELFL